jgi:UDP-N-acetylglucosamine 1-carboxyvinyltransferase|tara:strand:+ start:9980 stop:11287 length:1308 start_codon:yes stop_codon:yes gene_type:complete
MNSVRITGGKRLKGEVVPQGAKNEALQILSAVLLTDEKITINNVPDIIDVNKLIEILKNLGVNCSSLGNGSFQFSAKAINLDYLKSDEFILHAKSLRGSIMLVGPLLTRYKKASIPRPGGDKIGRRRLDTHFVNLEKLGAKLDYDSKDRIYNVKTQGLIGTDILLEEASVTGTANLIMASVLAEGKTTIYNAACEPYIQQLCSFLIKMGANINGVGSNLLSISGVKKLNGANHTILPDMIEIGSWIGLAAMTRSEIKIKDVSWENLGQIPNTFRKLGIKIIKEGDDMIIPSHEDGYEISSYIDGSILTISDAPWPGFSPDLISIILVVATQARGSILVHQKMFESRLFFVDKLIDMGAKIILSDPHRASTIGLDFKSQLKPTVMSSPDIRAGIALLIAALSANGTSEIQNFEQIDRGYENIVSRLKKLGASIDRI